MNVKGLFIKWAIMSLTLIVAVGYFLVRQLDNIGFGFGSGAQPGQTEAVMADADLPTLRSVRLVPDADPAAPAKAAVSVSGLRVVTKIGNVVTIGLHLSAAPETTEYPGIRVYLQSNGKTVRTVDFAPQRYSHGTRLFEEDVRLPITLHEGETGCTASVLSTGDGGHA